MTIAWKRVALGIGIALCIGTVTAGCLFVTHARKETRRTLCRHSLKQVASMLSVYAKEHEGAFPGKWSNLIKEVCSPTARDYFDYLNSVFICPERLKDLRKKMGRHNVIRGPEDADSLCSYALVTNAEVRRATSIAAYEKDDNHGGTGYSVLYSDGHTEWKSPQEWSPLAAIVNR